MLSLTRKALEEFDNPQGCKRSLSAATCLFLVLLMGFPCVASARTLEDYLKAFQDKRQKSGEARSSRKSWRGAFQKTTQVARSENKTSSAS